MELIYRLYVIHSSKFSNMNEKDRLKFKRHDNRRNDIQYNDTDKDTKDYS
jgi:hypothetical protein